MEGHCGPRLRSETLPNRRVSPHPLGEASHPLGEASHPLGEVSDRSPQAVFVFRVAEGNALGYPERLKSPLEGWQPSVQLRGRACPRKWTANFSFSGAVSTARVLVCTIQALCQIALDRSFTMDKLRLRLS